MPIPHLDPEIDCLLPISSYVAANIPQELAHLREWIWPDTVGAKTLKEGYQHTQEKLGMFMKHNGDPITMLGDYRSQNERAPIQLR
jgi:hypothetical protein